VQRRGRKRQVADWLSAAEASREWKALHGARIVHTAATYRVRAECGGGGGGA
jgi:hypothetical protein